jgi:hypothetical protein
MRGHIVAAAVAACSLAAGGPAAAQYGYAPPAAPAAPVFTPAGYAPVYTPAAGYGGNYAPVPTYAPGSPSYGFTPGGVYGGYAVEPVDPAAAGVVRGLYHRYLGREPDPDGLRFWANRLAALGGDTGLLATQFAAAAGTERATYRPVYTSPRRPFRRFR